MLSFQKFLVGTLNPPGYYQKANACSYEEEHDRRTDGTRYERNSKGGQDRDRKPAEYTEKYSD